MYKQHLSLATALILSGLLASCAGSVSTGKPVDNPTSAQSNSLKIFTFTDLNEDGVFEDGDGERLVEGIRMQIGYKGGVQDCYSGTITGASSCVFDASTLPDDTYYLSIKAVPTGIPGFLRTLMNQYATGWNVIENGQTKWVDNIFFDKSRPVVSIGDMPVKLPTDIPSRVIQFKKNQPQAREIYFPIPVLERAPKPDVNGRSNYVESVGHATTRIQNTLAEGRGYIMGVLTDTSGKPLPGISVNIRDSLATIGNKFEFQGIKTDSDGRFVFSYVPAGTYDLYVPTDSVNDVGAANLVKLKTGIVVQQARMTDLGRPQLTKDPGFFYTFTPCIDRGMDGLCDVGDGKLNIARDLQFPREDLPLPQSYLDPTNSVFQVVDNEDRKTNYLFQACENGLCFTVLPKNQKAFAAGLGLTYTNLGTTEGDQLIAIAAIPDANPIQYVYNWNGAQTQLFIPPSDNICNKYASIKGDRYWIVNRTPTYFPEYYDGDAILVGGFGQENESLACYASGNFDFIPFEDKNADGTWDIGEPRIPRMDVSTKSVVGNATLEDPRFDIVSYSRLGPVDPSTGMNTLRTRMVQFFGQSQTDINYIGSPDLGPLNYFGNYYATTPNAPSTYLLRISDLLRDHVKTPLSHRYVPNAGVSYWGYAFPAEVHIYIFEDVDADKRKSYGVDAPLANVKVRVTDYSGIVLYAQTNEAGEAVVLAGAGQVQIEVVKETLPNADKRVFTETSGSGFSKTILLKSNGTLGYERASFGYKVERSGQLEGVLFDDSNGNGSQDPGEIGLRGIKLTAIRNDATNPADREQYAITDGSGRYNFPALKEGSAQVVFQDQDIGNLYSQFKGGFKVTAPKGANHFDDEFGKRVAASMNIVGEQKNTLNFGLSVPRNDKIVSLKFFDDQNGDGTRNLGEAALDLTDRSAYFYYAQATGTWKLSGVGWSLAGAEMTGAKDALNEPVLQINVPKDQQAQSIYMLSDKRFTAGPPYSIYSYTSTSRPDLSNISGARIYNDLDLPSRQLDKKYIFPLLRIDQEAQNAGTIEIGIQKKALSFSGVVFDDQNGNGIKEATEPVVPGAVIADGARNVTSGADGTYTLTNVTDANGYKINVSKPGTSASSVQDVFPFFIQDGASTRTLNLPIRLPRGTVTGSVFEDIDGNGKQDGAETVLPNVTVKFTDLLGNVSQSTTNLAGVYTFGNAVSGAGSITIDTASLPNYAPTTGTLPMSVNVLAGPTSLAPIGMKTTLSTGSIQGKVFDDANGNGTQDTGEMGLANVRLTAKDGKGIVTQILSDASGNYAFNSLTPGRITIDLDATTAPTDYALTTTGSMAVDLRVGQNIIGKNFGLQTTLGTVSGRLFYDKDEDDVLDESDTPAKHEIVSTIFENVKVVMRGTDGKILKDKAGNDLITYTDSNGYYTFNRVPVGAAQIEVDDVSFYRLTNLTNPRPVDVKRGNVAGQNFGFYWIY
ncbi:MAG: SdrD B-like domain-containing protein [Deinococcaceae bacterium]